MHLKILFLCIINLYTFKKKPQKQSRVPAVPGTGYLLLVVMAGIPE